MDPDRTCAHILLCQVTHTQANGEVTTEQVLDGCSLTVHTECSGCLSLLMLKELLQGMSVALLVLRE